MVPTTSKRALKRIAKQEFRKEQKKLRKAKEKEEREKNARKWYISGGGWCSFNY